MDQNGWLLHTASRYSQAANDMRLTAKGRYAVTAMLDIAMNQEVQPVSVQEISKRQSISAAYLEQIVAKLKKAGLLSSARGPGGGYKLGQDPNAISISTIVAAVGEGVDVTRCGGRVDCQEGHMCLTHDLWASLSGEIDEFLRGITLQNLVMRQHHAESQPNCADEGVIRATIL